MESQEAEELSEEESVEEGKTSLFGAAEEETRDESKSSVGNRSSESSEGLPVQGRGKRKRQDMIDVEGRRETSRTQHTFARTADIPGSTAEDEASSPPSRGVQEDPSDSDEKASRPVAFEQGDIGTEGISLPPDTAASRSTSSLQPGQAGGTIGDNLASQTNPLMSQDPRFLNPATSNQLLFGRGAMHQVPGVVQLGQTTRQQGAATLGRQQQGLGLPAVGSTLLGTRNVGNLASLVRPGQLTGLVPTTASGSGAAMSGTHPISTPTSDSTAASSSLTGVGLGLAASGIDPMAAAMTLRTFEAARMAGQPLGVHPGYLFGGINMLPSHVPSPGITIFDATQQPLPISAASLYGAASGIAGSMGAASGANPLAASGAMTMSLPPPMLLYMECDQDSLSDYQCLVRKNIELFAADTDDTETGAQGRNKAIVLGQVGIRCIHCRSLHPRQRARGATYYPSTLEGLYQAAQNMANHHLVKACTLISHAMRQELLILRDRKSSAGGGKHYWADGLRAMGVVEESDGRGLRFQHDLVPKESTEPSG